MLVERDQILLSVLESGLTYITAEAAGRVWFPNRPTAARRLYCLYKQKYLQRWPSGVKSECIYGLAKSKEPIYKAHLLACLKLYADLAPTGRITEFQRERPIRFKMDREQITLRPDAYLKVDDQTFAFEFHNQRPAASFVQKVKLYEGLARDLGVAPHVVIEAANPKAVKAVIDQVKTLDKMEWIICDKAGSGILTHLQEDVPSGSNNSEPVVSGSSVRWRA